MIAHHYWVIHLKKWILHRLVVRDEHQSRFPGHLRIVFLQFFGHTGSPTLIECKHSTAVQCIALQAKAVLLTYMGQNHHVITLTLAHWTYLPSTKATRCDLHNPAQKLHWPNFFPSFDESKSHRFWLAKKPNGDANITYRSMDGGLF